MARLDDTMTEQSKPAAGVSSDGLGSVLLWWRRRRLLVALLAFLGFVNLYAVRVNISVAIVDMVSNRSVTTDNGTVIYEQDFPWDSRLQSLVLSMFFYGYSLTQIPGGWLATRFGGARLVGIGVAGSVLLSVVTPPLARASVYLLMAARVLVGCFQGMAMPAMNEVWAHWAPVEERSRLYTVTLSGCTFGTVVAMAAAGIIASTIGWPSVFYVFGGTGLLWYFFWVFSVKNSPEEDSKISPTELKHIIGKKDYSAQESKNVVTPWLKIFTTPPFIAAVIAHFAANYGLYMFLTEMPTFISDILKFDIQKTGFLSAVPHLVMCILLQISGHVSDNIQKRKFISVTQLRKFLICGSFLIQAGLLVLASYVTNSAVIALCLTMCLGAGSLTYAALCVIFMDLSPLHSSILAGISCTVANLSGIVAPVIAGFIVRNKRVEEWRIVFFITTAIYITAALIYGVLGSAERQPWAIDAATTKIQSAEVRRNENFPQDTKDAITHF